MRLARLASFALLLTLAGAAHAQTRRPPCAPDNAGITLPQGFCALVVAEGLGAVRHLVLAPNGDIFAARRGRRPPSRTRG